MATEYAMGKEGVTVDLHMNPHDTAVMIGLAFAVPIVGSAIARIFIRLVIAWRH